MGYLKKLGTGFGILVIFFAVIGAIGLALKDNTSSPSNTAPTQSPNVPTQSSNSFQAAPEPSKPRCDPSYVGVCIPPPPPDLDCKDVPSNIRVVGSDPHGLDRDNDGIGCES